MKKLLFLLIGVNFAIGLIAQETTSAPSINVHNLTELKKNCYRCYYGNAVAGYYMEHRLCDGTKRTDRTSKIYQLFKNDVEYLDLPNVKTALQKKMFIESADYSNNYKNIMEAEKNALLNDDFYVEISEDIVDKGYDIDNKCFKFTFKYFPSAISSNKKGTSFYYESNRFFIDYPKSNVAIKIGDVWSTCTLYTCQVPESDALEIENQNYYHLICVFNVKDIKKDGNIYNVIGKSKKLYIVNWKGDFLYDVSSTLSAPNINFRSYKKAPIKKSNRKYHERGRMEDCGLCLGTGKGTTRGTPCIQCGGKGWYIEHYW